MGLINLNCHEKCPEECTDYDKWQYWEDLNNRWANNDSSYEVKCSSKCTHRVNHVEFLPKKKIKVFPQIAGTS